MGKRAKERRRKRRAEQAQAIERVAGTPTGLAEGANVVSGCSEANGAERAGVALAPPTPTDSIGGLGDTVPDTQQADPRNGIRDVRLVERAFREGWPIPEAALQRLPSAMTRIALDRTKNTRERVAAAKVVVSMHGQNLSATPRQVNHQHAHVHALREELLQNETVLEECRTNRADADTPAVHYENPEENRGNNADGENE